MLEVKDKKEVSSFSVIPEGFFEKNDLIERVRFKDIDFNGYRFKNTGFKGCEFENCSFVGCIFDNIDLQRIKIINSKFIDTNLASNFRFITGSCVNTLFQGCDFTGSFIQNVKYIGCTFDGIDFSFTKKKSVDFTGSNFVKICFDGSSITRGIFKNITNIRKSLFYNVKLDDCEFDWSDAFIIMEFGNDRYDELYEYGIKPVLARHEIDPKRVDKYEFHGRITDEILQNIITSKVVIAECSATNKNVYFEIGYALGNKKHIILCIDDAKNIPFDLKDFPFIVHGNKLKTFESQLDQKLRFVLNIKEKDNS